MNGTPSSPLAASTSRTPALGEASRGLTILAAPASAREPVLVEYRVQLSAPSPASHLELRSGPRGRYIHVPEKLLEETLDQLTGVRRATALRFTLPLELDAGGGAGALRLLDFILAETDQQGGLLTSSILEGRLAEALVCALLVGLRHNYSHLLRASRRPPIPPYVLRAEQYLEVNAHRQVSNAEVAAKVGVNTRTLLGAFRSYRQTTPAEFARERRFELARMHLQATATTSVAEVARAYGFVDLTRFAAGFLERFGESPEDALARAAPGARDMQ